MPLSSDIKFQKTLALAASASNQFEAEAAELAARRLMAQHNIDPTDIPDKSLYNRINFADNQLLKKLRAEWHQLHPVSPARSQERLLEERGSQQGRSEEWQPSDGTPSIRFNIKGYRNHIRHEPIKRRPDLTDGEYELIRIGYNDGLRQKAIAVKYGFNVRTVNSVRWRLGIDGSDWVKDEHGKWQWNRPFETAGQPGGERRAGSERNESGSPPSRHQV